MRLVGFLFPRNKLSLTVNCIFMLERVKSNCDASGVNCLHSRSLHVVTALRESRPGTTWSVEYRACRHAVHATKLTESLMSFSLPHCIRIGSSTSLLTYSLLTPWSRVILEKLTGFLLFKNFPAFYGTRRFITAFTSARHLSQLDPAHTPTSHFLNIHLNIILPYTPGSSKWSLSLRFPHHNPVYASPLPHMHQHLYY